MSWRDNMGPASFRGVPFFVKTSEFSGGRRVVKHEYPFRNDAPFTEDMGRKGHTFPVEGFVIGADYFTARNKLLDALDKPGPGELVHPYHGTLRVVAVTFRVSETAENGGMATFSLEFEETAAEPTKPTTVVDAKAAVTASATALKTSAGTQFLAAFRVLSDARASVSGALRSAMLAVNNVVSGVAMAEQSIADLNRQIEGVTSSVAGLLQTPESLVASQTSLFQAIGEGLLTVVDALNPSAQMLSLYSFDPGTRPPATTQSRADEQGNFDAIQRLTQRLTLAEAAAMIVQQTFVSYDDAVSARTAITNLIDDQIEAVADDVFPDLNQLRADLVGAVPGDDSDLPRLTVYTPRLTLPSLVLAQRLYGDIFQELELVSRNKISNPCFIHGGESLEVLSDE